MPDAREESVAPDRDLIQLAAERGLQVKRCPYCAEAIEDAAVKCKHCGEFLDPALRPSKPGEELASQAAARKRASDLNKLSFAVFFLALLGYMYVSHMVGYVLFGIALVLNLAVDRMKKKEKQKKV